MRRSIIAVILGLIAPLAGVVGVQVAVAPAANAITCTSNHYSTDYEYVTHNATLDEDPKWRIMTELQYRHCQDGTQHWADPLIMKIGCRRESNASGWNMTARFDPYLWDRDGHTINPAEWAVSCNLPDQTWNTELHYFDAASKFHLCQSPSGPVPPKWRTDVTLDIDNDFDEHTTLAGTFWGYTGPTAVTC